MTDVTAPAAVDTDRQRRPGTAWRRYAVLVELAVITAAYLVGFEILIDPMRRFETNTVAFIFRLAGSHGVTVARGDSLLIAPHGKRAILAGISPSCSSLMGILALGALAVAVFRKRRGHAVLAFVIAGVLLFVANTARMAASCLAGLAFGQGALVLFHDWVGTVWNFAATLLGFLVLLYLTLPTTERAEQDRAGRHTARRPEGWASAGLGYRMPTLVRVRPHRRTFTGFFVRHFLPAAQRRRMARRRESGRVDYRIGFLEPDQRCQAIADLVADGLGAHGATLLAIATYEEHPQVLGCLATAVEAHPGPHETTAPASLALWARAWRGARLSSDAVPPATTGSWEAFLTRRRRLHDRRVLRQLSQLDAPERAAAVASLAAEGLGFRRAALVTVAANEESRAVLDALVDAVAKRQWEPTTSPAIAALRLFARAWLLEPFVVASADDEASADARSSARPGRSVRVAVTGVGGPAGFSVARELLRAGHEVIGLDADPLAAGLRLDGIRAYSCRRVSEEGFADELIALLTAERIEALITTVDEELVAMQGLAARLADIGCRCWLPDLAAIGRCLDKGLFALTMQDYGVPHPPTATTARASRNVPGPFVVKPRQGRGSRGILYLDDRRQMRRALRRDPGLIVQSRLAGEEWTADVLVDRNGQFVTCVPRWRLEVRGGISVKGVTFDSADVTRVCAEAVAAVGLTGPANVQGMVDGDGRVAVIEINPRFSGGLPLTIEAGADVVGAYLRGALEPEELLEPLYFTPGVVMVRHFDEVFEEGADVSESVEGETGEREQWHRLLWGGYLSGVGRGVAGEDDLTT